MGLKGTQRYTFTNIPRGVISSLDKRCCVLQWLLHHYFWTNNTAEVFILSFSAVFLFYVHAYTFSLFFYFTPLSPPCSILGAASRHSSGPFESLVGSQVFCLSSYFFPLSLSPFRAKDIIHARTHTHALRSWAPLCPFKPLFPHIALSFSLVAIFLGLSLSLSA